MLQEGDGILVFPVRLDNHALNLATLHAEDAVGELAHGEAAVAHLALVLPHVVELRLLGGLRASLLAQLVHLRRDGGLERVDALARERTDAVELRVDGAVRELVAAGRGDGVGSHALGELLADLLGTGDVDLVGHDDARARREVARVQLELAVDHLVVMQGVAPLVVAREVDHVHDERGALDVAEELVPKPTPLVRALDKARDVGADEA